MGQELLNRGVIPHGTIWGATALLHKKYHKLLVKTHLDFIKAGAEIIVTNSFGSRKRRLMENKLSHKFTTLNKLGLIPIVVHGGGKRINNKLNELGIKSEFIKGLRVTTKETIEVVEKVLTEFNKEEPGKLINNLVTESTIIGKFFAVSNNFLSRIFIIVAIYIVLLFTNFELTFYFHHQVPIFS